MDIKKTRILHKRYTLAEWQSNTLRQGELGFLLSDDQTKILEIRAGTHDILTEDGRIIGVPWEEALLLSAIDGINIEDYATVEQLNKHIQDFIRLDVLVNQHSEAIETFSDTDTRVQISGGVAEGTLHIDIISKDGYVSPGYDVAIPGWDNLLNIALGRTTSHVYDSKEDESYKQDIMTPNKYKVGDIIYFRDTDTPDEWVTKVLEYPNETSLYEFSTLKVESPVLDNYVTHEAADNKYLQKSALEALTVDPVGGDDSYISAVGQIGGKVTVVKKQLPDIDGKIEVARTSAIQISKTYTDNIVGDLGTDSSGATVTVAQYVNKRIQVVQNLVDDIVIKQNEQATKITQLNNTTLQHTEQLNTLTTNVSNLNSRVTQLEQNSGSGGSGISGVSVVKVDGKVLPIDSTDNSVNIQEISTDLLVSGTKTLILDCEDKL